MGKAEIAGTNKGQVLTAKIASTNKGQVLTAAIVGEPNILEGGAEGGRGYESHTPPTRGGGLLWRFANKRQMCCTIVRIKVTAGGDGGPSAPLPSPFEGGVDWKGALPI
jgi:hypothetical protein